MLVEPLSFSKTLHYSMEFSTTIHMRFSNLSFANNAFSAPEEPSNVVAENVTSTSLSVRWSTGSTQNIANVSVFYRDLSLNGDFTEVQVEQTNATNCSITVDSLTPGHQYEFYVRVCSFDKCSRSPAKVQSTGNIFSSN